MMWGWGGGPFWGFGGLFMWIVPVALIALVVWAVSGSRRASGRDAEETLKLRLARGEISEDEYRRLKDLLR